FPALVFPHSHRAERGDRQRNGNEEKRAPNALWPAPPDDESHGSAHRQGQPRSRRPHHSNPGAQGDSGPHAKSPAAIEPPRRREHEAVNAHRPHDPPEVPPLTVTKGLSR